MEKILDNPETFFNNLSNEEFKKILDEYEFNYIDLNKIKEKENKE